MRSSRLAAATVPAACTSWSRLVLVFASTTITTIIMMVGNNPAAGFSQSAASRRASRRSRAAAAFSLLPAPARPLFSSGPPPSGFGTPAAAAGTRPKIFAAAAARIDDDGRERPAARAIKASVYMAVTLDGKIARRGGDVSFLSEYESDDAASEMFREYLSTVDAIVMGRATFETVLGFGPEAWPYGATRMVVMTRDPEYRVPADVLRARRHEKSEKDVAAAAATDDPVITTSSLRPSDLLADLEGRGFRHACVDGGRTVRSFLRENLVDELTLTAVPRVLGRGAVALFEDGDGERGGGGSEDEIALEPIRTVVLPNGLVTTRYAVRRG
jgi:dihydrofolate reductase